MGTSPASIQRTIPDSGQGRTPETGSPASKSEKTAGPETQGSGRSGRESRSGKAAHRKSSFAALYRGVLEGPAGSLQDPAGPAEIPSGTDSRKSSRGAAPSKPSGHARKKKGNSSGEAISTLPESMTDLSRKKEPTSVRPSREETVRPGPVLWGPLVRSKEVPFSPPLSPETGGQVSPPQPSRSREAPPETSFPALLTRSDALRITTASPESGKPTKKIVDGSRDLRKGETEVSREDPRSTPVLSSEVKSLLPEKAVLSGELPPTTREVSSSSAGGLSVPEKPGSSHGSGEGAAPSFQTLASGAAEGALVRGAVAEDSGKLTPGIPEGLSARVGTLAREGGGQVALEVKPPHLGPVGVRVHVDPHTRLVTVELSSHDPRIRNLLSEKEGSIKESLSQSGFVLDRFQVVSQNLPGSDSTQLAALSGTGSGGMTDVSDGRSAQGDQGSPMAGGGSGGQDPAGQGRPEPGASGREGNRGGSESPRGSGNSDPDRGIEGVPRTETGGEGARIAGYHRIV
ncbi:MAG: flagellar hook-length control protein FliK [Nitrospirae bacterium]|nr:flagellar hook-length control protein FliK [Nitrospirota bacterium]